MPNRYHREHDEIMRLVYGDRQLPEIDYMGDEQCNAAEYYESVGCEECPGCWRVVRSKLLRLARSTEQNSLVDRAIAHWSSKLEQIERNTGEQ